MSLIVTVLTLIIATVRLVTYYPQHLALSSPDFVLRFSVCFCRSSPFEEFACNFAIQCTETYEYGMCLATPNLVLPTFQVYKFIYLLRLVDYGFLEEVKRFCHCNYSGRVLQNCLFGMLVHFPGSCCHILKALYDFNGYFNIFNCII